MSQYTIIYKYGKSTRQLNFEMELNNFPSRNNAGENRFAPELNEKEVIELLQNATLGRVKKAAKYGMKIFSR